MDFTGKRILVVEDDYLLARDVCQDLQDLGATVLGPAPTPYYARLLLGRRSIDGAVLDIRLHGTSVLELATEIADQQVPIVFATAYDEDLVGDLFKDASRLSKPFGRGAVAKALKAAIERPRSRPRRTEPEARPVFPASATNSLPTELRLARVIAFSLVGRR